ncbi:MAG TPA: radical SAM protein [Vicinamibacterales bacterium]|nr:radical SAM protein [Vicinamibacterales bacterium]
MTLNACEFEIDLFCRGVRVPESVELEGSRSFSRTRAGLGSGLEIAIPTGSRLKPLIYTNVPVVERFVEASPYALEGAPASGYAIRDTRDGTRREIRVLPEPAWYTRLTSREVPMSRIGVLQGTYLGIYINPVCAFWTSDPPRPCAFCTTGRNVGEHEIAEKTLEDVVETCWAAREESGVTFVHLNGGFQGMQALKYVEPYVRAIKEEVGLLVGLQLTPHSDFREYDRLIDLGVDHFSFCLELFDPEWFARICPGKARTLGQDLFLAAMDYCASRLPRGAVSGEMIAGIEPIESTLAAIDRIAAAGAFPTVCIFRPTIGSGMEDWPSPRYEDMRTVMAAVYDACRRHRVPIGLAPNIEVSLVVNPDDAALLAERTAGFYAYEAWRRALRQLARPVFWAHMRTRRRNSAVPPPQSGAISAG